MNETRPCRVSDVETVGSDGDPVSTEREKWSVLIRFKERILHPDRCIAIIRDSPDSPVKRLGDEEISVSFTVNVVVWERPVGRIEWKVDECVDCPVNVWFTSHRQATIHVATWIVVLIVTISLVL